MKVMSGYFKSKSKCVKINKVRLGKQGHDLSMTQLDHSLMKQIEYFSFVFHFRFRKKVTEYVSSFLFFYVF